MKSFKTLIFFWLSLTTIAQNINDDLTQYVDSFIGTGGHGHTFPGATVPFGMMQLSPDTRLTGWDGCSGYHYTDSLVYGFSHTHLSGTGVSDYGDVLLMPYTGKTFYNNGADGKPGYRSSYKKENEKATAGYYETYLDEDDILVKLTSSTRCGHHKYTYKKGENRKVLLDLVHRDVVTDAHLKKVSDYEIEGYRHSTAWAKDQHLFFVIQFMEPIKAYELLLDDKIAELTEIKGKAIKASFDFGISKANSLGVKVGISSVDIEGARKNLEAEIAYKTFNEIKVEAKAMWQKELNKIKVGYNNEELSDYENDKLTTFYSALYHTMIAPNTFSDVDGRYRGTDLEIYKAEDYTHYTVFSLWDTYRAAHPLYTIIDEERTNHFIKTFLNQYQQGGQLPMWELAANYTGCMIGYHAVPVIADAYIKGIKDYDAELALQAMIAASTAQRLGIPSYIEEGFLSGEVEAECVSKTLEYAYDDFTIAQMAAAMGKIEIAEEYFERAQYYKNVLDPETKFMRARLNNQWFSPFNAAEVNFNYTEANAWQYSFYVPQDVTGFIDLLGGEAALEKQLDALFSASSETKGRDQVDITGLIGQYAHGNEPSHHIAYLYNYIGKPHKTQKYVRQIINELYTAQPNGYSGNEDCGQMSAWYVLSSLGFYSVCPGTNQYVIGSPVFDYAHIKTTNGKTFSINVAQENSGTAPYIKTIKRKLLNEQLEDYTKSYLTHADILAGGEFFFTMDDTPNFEFGKNEENRPVTKIETKRIVAVPAIFKGERSFREQTTIGINCATPNAIIYYQIDKEETKVYSKPFIISKDCDLTVWATKEGYSESKKATSDFHFIENNKTIELATAYASHYSAGGDYALIDEIFGGNDFRVGNWQGYQYVNLEATIDLGNTTSYNEIAVNFLQDENSWIFMPLEVQFLSSNNGIDFDLVAIIKNEISPKESGSIIKAFKSSKAGAGRYIKIVAKNRQFCPDYHKGAGGKSWIFADEVSIK